MSGSRIFHASFTHVSAEDSHLLYIKGALGHIRLEELMGILATATQHSARRSALAAAVLSTWCAFAYAQAPVHKHYDAPEHATKPSASGALAPRLQNVGKHTFPTTCASDQAQLFMNQGL